MLIFFGIDDLSSIIFDRSSSDEAAFGRRSIADNSGKQKSGLCTKFKRYCTDKYLHILVLRWKRIDFVDDYQKLDTTENITEWN